MTALVTQGSWGRLASPAEISTGPVWPTFFASISPAEHGRFFYRQLKSGTYRIHKKYAVDIEAKNMNLYVMSLSMGSKI
jgi:predicted AlkP superfamily phosphohydrolase/phosphomutase